VTRRGYSLAELLVALVIAGAIGVSLSKLVISQARFLGTQQGMMAARSGARAGLNVMVQELHMITPGGVIAANRDSVTVRVPFAFGVTCIQPAGGSQAIAVFPYDSATYASATASGYAYKDSTGTWQFKEPLTAVAAGVASDCTSGLAQPVTVLTNGKIVRLSPNVVGTKVGYPAYLYQKVRYAFATSAQLTGRRALWRTLIDTGERDEMVAPFDTSSHFSFLTGNNLTASTSVPAVLDSLRGVKVRLVGQSENAPEGRTAVSSFDLTTNIVFVNRAP
jgi:prepilin-type N-terminal cleavage/methylation domain-containing protein